MAVALLTLLTVSAMAHTWSGQIETIYDLNRLDLNPEGILYSSGKLYTGSVGGQSIYEFDTDDLSKTTAAAPKIVSEPHTAGSQITLGVCRSSSKDRIYGCLTSLAGTELGGLCYWDDDSTLSFQKCITVPGVIFANACRVDDGEDLVYFTATIKGSIYACDRDLTSCKEMINHTSLKPTTQFGVNGLALMDDYMLTCNTDTGALMKIPYKGDATTGDLEVLSVTDPNNVMVYCNGLVKVDDDVIVISTRNQLVVVEALDDFKTVQTIYNISMQGIDTDGAGTVTVFDDDYEDGELEVYVSFPNGLTQLGTNQSTFKLVYAKLSGESHGDDWAGMLAACLLLAFF